MDEANEAMPCSGIEPVVALQENATESEFSFKQRVIFTKLFFFFFFVFPPFFSVTIRIVIDSGRSIAQYY